MEDVQAATDPPQLAVFRLPMSEELPETSVVEEPIDDQPDDVLLRENAKWFCQLRWIVAGILTLVGALALPFGQFQHCGLTITPTWPLVTAAVLALYNLAFLAAASIPADSQSALTPRRQLWLQIIADLLVLTAVVHFLGTLLTPAPFMYLFHIILACIFLSGRDSLLVSLLAIALYLCCETLECLGWLEPTTVLSAATQVIQTHLTPEFVVLRSMSVVAIWSVIWLLTSRLAGMVRHRELELAATNRRLAASTAERAQHMLETTHQLKAPFAAIHANTQLLMGGYCGELPEAARAIVEKIAARSAALSKQIQEMLQLANLRSTGQLPPVATQIDLSALVESTIAHWLPSARQRRISFNSKLSHVTVEGVEDHLRMLLDNLIANAVNYSFDGGQVEVGCEPRGSDAVLLTVRDHGIGISGEKLHRVFDDYYRTEEAVRHNRASTGLGLAIVRHVAREMQIEISLESQPGWGTRFTLVIPRTRHSLPQPLPAKEK